MAALTLEYADKASHSEKSMFLTFQLAGEEYGIDILAVQEIRGFSPLTRLPNSPKHVTGVLNLRGAIVPLFDLRQMFELPEIEYDQFAAIVVVTIDSRVSGLIVDRVSEVVDAVASDIQPAPNISGGTISNCVFGILRKEERLIILLDAHDLLNRGQPSLALAA